MISNLCHLSRKLQPLWPMDYLLDYTRGVKLILGRGPHWTKGDLMRACTHSDGVHALAHMFAVFFFLVVTAIATAL